MNRRTTSSLRASRARIGSSTLSALVYLTLLGMLSGCHDRVVGTVEPFVVGQKNELKLLEEAPHIERASDANPTWGDLIRLNTDVVTMQVESTYLQDLPFRLTGSRDVIIFVNVWENAAAGYENSESLTSIVYLGKNQKIPGKCNFFDALAYGPTKFKGHPLRVRFTVMVLQKKASEQQAQIVDVISAFATAAAPQYAGVFSPIAKAIQGILRAQPDIVCFDFEGTWVSDRPEGLLEPITPLAGTGQSANQRDATQPVVVPVYWLQYGRFVLLETESYDFTRQVEHKGVKLKNGRLLKNGVPLKTNYMVVRFTPGQQPENNEVLASAARANDEMLKTLRRSDEDIAKAFADLHEAADGLRDEVLRTKAEEIARSLARKHDGDPDGFVAEFDQKWGEVTGGLNAADKAKADTIGGAVRDRWKALVGTKEKKTLDDEAIRDKFRKAWLKGSAKDIKLNGVTFAIASVEFDPNTTPFDTIKVELTKPATAPTTKVKQEELKKAIAATANNLLKNQNVTGDPIKTVNLVNLEALKDSVEQ